MTDARAGVQIIHVVIRTTFLEALEPGLKLCEPFIVTADDRDMPKQSSILKETIPDV